MSIEITGTNHGLSVYTEADGTTGADTADNRRLLRPVPQEGGIIINNTFNDATSGDYYRGAAGHNGIDFECVVGTEVEAMYGGVVIEIKRDWKVGPEEGYGNYVKILSCTNPASQSGFSHVYAHLEGGTNIVVTEGDTVRKGDKLGTSGESGTYKNRTPTKDNPSTTTEPRPHLHVHLRPFDSEGRVPPSRENRFLINDVGVQDPVTRLADRIDGCMNFACFLPPDAQDAVNNHTHVPAPIASGTETLLSPRDAYANIPVHGDNNGERGSATGRIIHGKYLACYAVLGKTQVGNTTWYRIQYEAGTATDPGIRWVSSQGTVKGYTVTWVQVEGAPATPTGVQVLPQFATAPTSVPIRKFPSIPEERPDSNVLNQPLTAHRCHAVTGTYRDPSPSLRVPDAERYWWLIRYGKNEDGAPLTGWVRDNDVWTYGVTAGVTIYTGPADNPYRQVPDIRTLDRPPGQPVPTIGTPRILSATSTGTSVTLTWSAAPVDWDLPGGGVYHVSGYLIQWSQNPDALKDGAGVYLPVHARKTAGAATTETWTPNVKKGTMIHVKVAAYVGQFTGPAAAEPMGVVVGTGSLADHTFATADREDEPIRAVDDATSPICDRLSSGIWRRIHAVLPDWLQVPCREDDTAEAQVSGTQSASPTAAQDLGWVQRSQVLVEGHPLPATSQTVVRVQYLRLRSWVTGLHLRTGPSTAFPAYRLLTDTNAWYEVTGKTATAPVWYRLRYSNAFQGWVHGDYVELSERTTVTPIPVSTPPPMPAETGPADETGTGTGTTTGAAAGDFRNLVTNPDGRWSVGKSGTTVTANFSSPRSPVQYHARQNPQPQFVLPEGFRPTATVTHTVTGSQVDENRKPVPHAPAVAFDLTIGTNGEMRYVNNSKVDHLGYVNYNVTGLVWQSREALTVPNAPSRPGNIKATGVYLNQQVNRGSSWKLQRRGNAVSGSFGCTRSPVDYYANGSTREAQLLLPAAYRPRANARFRVKGAVRVNEDGSDSTDTRKVDFWLTVQPNGQMWYDADTNLRALGVGYLRYTVNVSWTAAPRITVPGVPRELEAEDIEATALELYWRSPAENGGAAIDGYRIQVWDADDEEWDTEESDTNSTRTRYDVEDLDPYTTYRFRVAAHNRAGWGAFGPAITATTRRKAPGAPAGLSATAAHDAVTLTWGTATGTVTGYRIERRTGSRTWDTLVADTGTTARAFVDRTVSPATTYRYRVAAHNRGAAGAWSQERSITTAAAPTIPGQITGLAVAPGTGSRLQLSWTAPTDTGGGITGHRIERSPDTTPRTWTVIREDTGSDTARWDDNDVAADTTYRYRVSARNSAGIGTPSAEAEGRSRPQLRLGGSLPYPLTAHASPWADAPVTATFAAYLPGRVYDLVGRVPGADGWWRVLLFDRDAQGTFWLPAAVGTSLGTTTALPQPPAAPTSFTASLAGGAVTLGWTATASGVTATGYRLWRQEDNGAWTHLGQDLDATTLTATDRAVRNGHVYRYRLQAQSDRGLGLPTATVALAVMATPAAPAAVTGLQATATTAALQLAWTRAATGGLPAGYRVAWRPAGGTGDFATTTVTGPAHALDNLISGTAYTIRVTAFNQEGDAPPTSHTATTRQVTPGVPAAVAVTLSGQNATVIWEAAVTGGPPDTYHLQTKTQAATDWPHTVTTVTGTTHTLTGLAVATAYDLRLRAANTAGVSDWVTATFTTAAAPQVPDAPTGLTAAPGADSRMQLTWTAPATGSAATGYRIERSTDMDPRVWTEVVADTNSTATTWHDRGLAAATTYHYRVTARNAAGPGTPSAEARARTRLQAALAATAAYPLTARRWPETGAPVSHTWAAHDTAVQLDVAGQGPGGGGWYRVLRFGQRADGPYWLPAGAVTITGATGDLPQAPGTPGNPTATAGTNTVTLAWEAPATGGTVTGYRLWRQAGAAAWTVLTDTLAADTRTHADTGLAADTAYRYRLQARSAAGHGPRTAVLVPAAAGPAPAPPVLTVYTQSGRVTLIVRGADGTVQQALDWSGPISGTATLTGRSGYHRLVVPAGRTLTVRARSRDAAGRWSPWVVRTLATR